MQAEPDRPGRTARAILAVAAGLAGSFLTAPAIPLLAGRAAPEERASEPPKPYESPTRATVQEGKEFFHSRDVAPVKISCADCHLILHPQAAPPDDLIRPGHNLFDAFGRGTWWNDRILTDCGEAAEVCLKRFQGADEMPPRARVGLVKYMKSMEAPVSVSLTLLRVPAARTDVSGGDSARGEDLYRRACAFCHPVDDGSSELSLLKSKMTPQEIGETIRTGFERMPFFQADILSEQEVADIAAYTYSLRPTSQ